MSTEEHSADKAKAASDAEAAKQHAEEAENAGVIQDSPEEPAPAPAQWENGSKVEVISGDVHTERSGPQPPKVHTDEVELMDKKLTDADKPPADDEKPKIDTRPRVYLPQKIHNEFNLLLDQARDMVLYGEVTLDGEPFETTTSGIPGATIKGYVIVEEVEGKKLKIVGSGRGVEFKYRTPNE